MCDNLDRNFDHSAKNLNKCIEEAIESLDSNQSTRTSLERALDTFLVCLKSEHNIIRLFNRICTQTLLNLIKLITKLNDKDVSEKAWKTLKISLFSKSHGNVYTEFVKNLPQSFIANSNYQVAVLFNTLKNESVSNLSAISGVFHLITKEILSVLNNDYKHKMQFVIFMADLLWGLMDSSENKLIVKSITNLLKVVEESNLFNPTTDQFNGGIFKSFLKSFLKKSFVCEFDEEYSELLVQLMRLDHLLLEQDLGLIVRKMEKNENLEKVLSAYLEESVKYRQLPRMTKNLIDVLKTDTTLPSKFYTKYGEYLESYQVDSQSILDIWKVANSTLETNNRCGETLELLNTLLNRVNLITLPLNLKPESIELLKQTESLIFDYLTKLKSESIIKGSNIVSKYLNCCFSCGFLYIILCRFSLSSNNDCLSTSANSLANVNRFLSVLYNEFKLDEKTNMSKIDLGKCNLVNLFYMNKLQLLNIHAFVIDGVVKIGRKVEETLLNEMFSIDLKAAKKNDFSSVFDDFNRESKIEDQEAFKLLHNKILVLDNLHVIIPLIKNETEALDNCFKNLLAVVYLADKNQMHPVNRETVFNDFVVCKEFETAFLKFLIELNLNDKSQGKVFLEMLESFLKNKNPKDLIERLCEFKNDFYLTKNQTKAFIKISTYFQIEHLSVKQSNVMFLLAERIKLDDETENFVLSIYFQLFKNDFFKHIPLSKFETWIFKFLADFSSNEKHPKDLIFEKIVRKSVAFLLRQQNVENMKTFLNKIITENRKLNDSDQKQMINQVLIHIVERISKILSVHSTDSTYSTDLKALLERITAHFIADQPIRTDNEKFLLCSILIRHRDLFPTSIEDYFKTLFNDCQKLHKKHRKSVKSVSASYIEFLKSTMLYKNEQFETAFESMFELYLNNETVIITDEFEKKESGQLVKTFTYIIKSLSTQQFEIVSGLFVKRIGLLYETGYLVKLADLFKLLCKDYELNDELKGIFSSFLQKIFLVQLPTIIGQLNSDNEISSLFKLLNAVNDIYGSKYFLFPSHLVISTLQSYSLLEFENYKIEHASEINQLLCRLLSVIMARYSKKFRNSTGVVSSILIKLINSTINVSNQLNLTDENVHLAVRMAKNLERIVAQLSPFKKFFVKQSPYILSEYFYKMSSLSVSNSVKPALTEMVFNLMHVCDLHGVSMLNVTLPNGPKELFKSAFVEYKRFFKYTGKV